MIFSKLAKDDFDRAVNRAFWRKVATWLSRRSNDLLPFDLVREHMLITGQHYIGLKQVEIDKIIGSTGRYMDFDRAFLPLQKHTRDRWINIDKAHYDQVLLPPVDLYKIGEIYFVKDGNHRVSVAREWGQEYIDAFVTEIDVPVPLTTDIQINDLEKMYEQANFLEKTGFYKSHPQEFFETNWSDQYDKLLDHISFHRWALGQKRDVEISFEYAANSWYETIYLPLVEAIRKQKITKDFSNHTETDLYLWITKYLWYLRMAYREEGYGDTKESKTAKQEAGKQLVEDERQPLVKRLISLLRNADWIDQLALEQEQASFYEHTQLLQVRPEAKMSTSVPGQFEKMLDHISVHRWYLGEQRNANVTLIEASQSWYDHVYLPLIFMVRDHGIMDFFPDRTETDLYLWIIEEQASLKTEYGEDISIEEAARQLAEKQAPKKDSETNQTDI